MENKKLVSLKSLLLRSWRERWPDTYWSIQAKQLLKFDAESDQSLLADLLLQQGLSGSTPNLLVISYFKHAVNSRMVSLHIGLESILKFEDSTKVYCLKALVEIIESLLPRICVNGTLEDSWTLGITSLKLVNWLLSVSSGCLEKIAEDCQSAEYATVAAKSCGVLDAASLQTALMALLRVALLENTELCQRMREYEGKSKSLLKSLDSPHIQMDAKVAMERGLSIASKIATQPRKADLILDPSRQPINASINVLLHIDAVLNLTGDVQSFIHQLFVLKTTQGISYPSLICDILRTCYVELIESSDGPDELKWSAFTFIKIPQIFVHLCRLPGAAVAHVVEGLEKFLNYQPLLDLVDAKCNAECMDLLCTELYSNSISLLNQSQMQVLLERRKNESKNAEKVVQANSQQSGLPSPSLQVLHAAPTVHTLLTTLESDHSKNLDGLIGVMGKMMGKNLNLLLTVAAASSGKVQAFATELIKFIEMTKHSSGEAGKGAQTRAHLFDMLFLMLCHIAQTYGLDMCHGNKPTLEKSFFVKWGQAWLPEDGQYKPLDGPLVHDDQRIDNLLTQIQPSGELKTSLTKWNEVMYNIRYAIQEIVNAWEYEALSQEQVKAILLSLKTKMGCLCVGAAAFLCSYISQVGHQRQQKPLQMIEMLLQLQPHYEPTNVFYLAERSQLVQMILSKLVQHVLPPSSPHCSPPPYSLPIKEPLQNVLEETWSMVFQSGTITTLQLQRMEAILSVGGCQWFSSVVINRLLQEERVEDLHKGACLLFSLFSLDMHNLTICLLHHTLPMLFQNCRNQLLTGPRGVVLAKLCISCLLMLQPFTPSGPDEEVVVRKSRKRTRTEIELEDSDLDFSVMRSSGRSKLNPYSRPSKIRKSESSGALPTAHLDNQDTVIIDPEEISTGLNVEQSMEPLDIAIAGLLRTFDGVIQGHQISEKTQFIHSFLVEVVRAGDQLSNYVVQFTPTNMIVQLLKLMPSQFDLDVLLAICDLSSTQGRKLASKVVCQYEQLLRKRSDAATV